MLALLTAAAVAQPMPNMMFDGHMKPQLPVVPSDSARNAKRSDDYDHTSNLQLRKRMSSSELGAGSAYGSDIWGCEKNGVELALMTFTAGLAAVDVTNPRCAAARPTGGTTASKSVPLCSPPPVVAAAAAAATRRQRLCSGCWGSS